MIIVTLTKGGAIRLPRDVLKHVNDAKHFHLRYNARGITLTPVDINVTVKPAKALP